VSYEVEYCKNTKEISIDNGLVYTTLNIDEARTLYRQLGKVMSKIALENLADIDSKVIGGL
jgi:hypothetical protein